MTYGFRIYNADGSVQIDSNSPAWLFLDDFVVPSGTVTKTYPGLAAATVTVMVSGVDSMAPAATVTQATSGSNKQITISAQRSARVRVMLE